MAAHLPNIHYFKLTPHTKKDAADLVTRKYSDEDMLTALRRLKSGKYTYRQCVQGLDIRISCLFYKNKQMNRGGVLRPPQGPKKKFDENSEKDMAAYLHYCWEIGIPKTQDRFAHELVHFMESFQIRNTFPKVVPGLGFFRRFKKENPDVRFAMPAKCDEYKYDSISLEEWATDNERFICDYNFGNLCSSPNCIFVVESQVLKWTADRNISFDVLIPYTGDGVVLQPIVAHAAEISLEVQNEFFPRLDFTDSENARLNFNSVGLCIQCISWYMHHYELEFSAVVYFAPDLTECISYAAWTFAQQDNIFIRQIQRCIYNDFKKNELGIFEKFEKTFLKKVKSGTARVATPRLFLNGLYRTCAQGAFRRHLRKGVKYLKLLTVEPQPPIANDNNDENLDEGIQDEYGEYPVNDQDGNFFGNATEFGVLEFDGHTFGGQEVDNEVHGFHAN